ncbi:DUF3854 domain-containing protein [Pontibacillus halophilus]|uniref:DUF3854 domain-containing protein n=1 Tax=Pontibacillus halophilus TaxID=516704 RepID=UPI00042484FC|nr:DUF3854 domain-containing protein [Pontibacillus halophilus]
MHTLRPTSIRDKETQEVVFYEYYREACPICNSTGACMVHKDGNKVVCIRTESDRPFGKNSAVPGWLHYLKGKPKKIDKAKVAAGAEKRGDDELDSVYRSLLNYAPLTQDHLNHLRSEDRQLSDEQIMTRQYKSFPDKPWNIVKAISKDLNKTDFEGIPGFYEMDGKYGKLFSLAGAKGILIPFRNQYNQIVGFQYRIDKVYYEAHIKVRKEGLKATIIEQPNLVRVTFKDKVVFEGNMEVSKKHHTIENEQGEVLGWVRIKKGTRYFWLSSANKPKGTASGSPAPIHISVPSEKLKHWEKGTLYKTDVAWIGEGPLKGDITSDLLVKRYNYEELKGIGDTIVSVPGVGAWRLAIPILKEMGVKVVNICFDMDANDNVHVKGHLMQLIAELKKENMRANLILWDQSHGKGIDDLYLHGKYPKIKSLF